MTLKLEYFDNEPVVKFILKNDDDIVLYHNSEIHDTKEFQKLSGALLKTNNPNIKKVIQSFYDLAEQLL